MQEENRLRSTGQQTQAQEGQWKTCVSCLFQDDAKEGEMKDETMATNSNKTD